MASPDAVASALGRRMHHWRLLPALVRAALPIVGVVVLRWPLPVVLFYYWLELALLAADSYILFLREGHAGNAIEGVLGALAIFAPVAIIAYYATFDLMTLSARIDYVLGLLDTPGLRVAVVLQVLVAIAFALVRAVDDTPGAFRLGKQMDLVLDRFLAILLAALAVGGLLTATGIGLPGTGNPLANAIAVSTISLVWLFSDLSPERLHRLTSIVRR